MLHFRQTGRLHNLHLQRALTEIATIQCQVHLTHTHTHTHAHTSARTHAHTHTIQTARTFYRPKYRKCVTTNNNRYLISILQVHVKLKCNRSKDYLQQDLAYQATFMKQKPKTWGSTSLYCSGIPLLLLNKQSTCD